ncbi:MAG: hypothetical protein IAE87_05675 [Rhodobacteraceae bacterium]|jgi:hypothetical protein|nr:hypothetical protein [Paracoccaceae bacterium]
MCRPQNVAMRIVETSAARLMAQSGSLALLFALGGGFFACAVLALRASMAGDSGPAAGFAVAAAGFVAGLALLGRREAMVLDRAGGIVVLSSVALMRQREARLALAGLRRAEVETKGARARVLLVWADGGRRPAAQAFVSGPGPAALAAAINGWLAGQS